MQVSQGVLCTIVVRIIVCINGLSLKTGDGIELLDCGCAKTSQGTEHRTLDFSHLCVFNGIHQCVLSLRGMILEFLCCVLLAERRDLVEVHLEVMGHLFGELVFRSSHSSAGNQECEGEDGAHHCQAM